MCLTLAISTIFSAILILLLMNCCIVSNANSISSDIPCLKSIQESLEDPSNNSIASWDFNNIIVEDSICNFTGIQCWSGNESRVLNIRLSGNGLKGEFPRGIEECNSLQGLDLSQNKLYGSIPSDISKIPYIIFIDLSDNSFTGEIPTAIANCTYLNVLRLDSNQLTGRIPEEIGSLRRLHSFNVANNHLSGPVPQFVNSNTGGVFGQSKIKFSYENNEGLCGPPLEPCEDNTNGDQSLFISGFSVGCSVAITISFYVSLLGFPCLFSPRKITNQEEVIQEEKKIPLADKLLTRMTFTELTKATNGFSHENIIGVGKMGTMYSAQLRNGWVVAIKWLQETEHAEQYFLSEMTTLGRLRDNNLVPLIGFCSESNKRLLIYNYISHGSLYDWLHAKGERDKFMEWPLRIKIAAGVARGLAWLHHNCNFTIVHNNINSTSVLLDEKFEPKLSNFWVAKFVSFHTNCPNWNPLVGVDFWELGFYKRDVYDFGTLLLELVAWKDANEIIDSSIQFSSNSFSAVYDAILELFTEGMDEVILDFIGIACECIRSVPAERPTMLVVYRKVQAIQEKHSPGNDPQVMMVSEISPASDSDSEEDNCAYI